MPPLIALFSLSFHFILTRPCLEVAECLLLLIFTFLWDFWRDFLGRKSIWRCFGLCLVNWKKSRHFCVRSYRIRCCCVEKAFSPMSLTFYSAGLLFIWRFDYVVNYRTIKLNVRWDLLAEIRGRIYGRKEQQFKKKKSWKIILIVIRVSSARGGERKTIEWSSHGKKKNREYYRRKICYSFNRQLFHNDDLRSR